MKPADLHSDMIITDRQGSLWRVTAVNTKCDRAHFLADMVSPGEMNGASSVTATYPLAVSAFFEPAVMAIS